MPFPHEHAGRLEDPEKDKKFTQFFQTMQRRVWALHPAKLEEIRLFLDRRLAGEKSDFPESAIGKSGSRADERPYDLQDGVAILSLYGILDKRMNMLMRFSGGTSTQIFARNFQQALADAQVRAILLDIDSPGGAVDGTKEAADAIFAARGQKPIVAYANGLMASAAYWIGAAADVVVGFDTAEVGSIGVALMHYDYSVQDEKLGIKRTAITAGQYKRIASDEKPLSAEGQAYLQELVDDYYRLFVEDIARQRDTDVETVVKKMADGRIFVGKKAKRAGLVDVLGNFDTARQLAQEMATKALVVTKKQGSNKEAQSMKEITLTLLEQEAPDLLKEIRDAARAEGLAAGCDDGLQQGRDAERSRVLEILTANGAWAIKLQAVQEGWEPKEAFKAMLDQQETEKAQALAELAKAAPPVVGQEVETITVDAGLPLEQRAKQEWDKDPKLIQEYKQFETYLAFRRAEEAGLVKIKSA